MEGGGDGSGLGRDRPTAHSSEGNLGEAHWKQQEIADETGWASFLL